MGLDIGGDDYITKPFKLGVLVSRINALLRRANSFQTTDTELQSNGIKVLLLQGQVFKNGELLDLTAAEYKLLCLFMRNPSICLLYTSLKAATFETGHGFALGHNPGAPSPFVTWQFTEGENGHRD